MYLSTLSRNKVYSKDMAKRSTGVGKHGKTHSHKTKKRLEVKRLMLAAKKSNRHQKRKR